MSELRRARRRKRRSARVLRRLLVTSATAATTFSPAVSRAEFDFFDSLDRGANNFGAGLFVGYQWGSQPGVEWGLEAFMMHRFQGSADCTSGERAGVGPLLQIGIRGLEDPRVSLALHGGGELARVMSVALTAEAGLSYRFGSKPGFGIHLGGAFEAVFLNTALRYQALHNDLWVGGGVRVFPTYGAPGSCSVGRPLRADFAQAPRPDLDTQFAHSPLSAAEDTRLAGLGFARDAQLECESVPAFLQLAAELAAESAPRSLVRRALAAANDEREHAELCARLASRYLSRSVRPEAPRALLRRALPAGPALERLAVESWLDGCIAEGIAAQRAHVAAEHASDPEAQSLQQRIAVDERRHAELAWSILDWSLERGRSAARSALRAVADVELAVVPETQAPSGLERHGRLAPRALAAAARAQLDASRARLRERGILPARPA